MIQDARARLQRDMCTLMAEANQKGRLQSGWTMSALAEAATVCLGDFAGRLAWTAFELFEPDSAAAVEPLTTGLKQLRDRLSDDLHEPLNRVAGRDPHSVGVAGNTYLSAAETKIETIVDDFAHGRFDGRDMTRERSPLHFHAEVHGSPGSVVQVGQGNVQTASTNVELRQLRLAIETVRQAPELASLPESDQDDIADHLAVIETEAAKPAPDRTLLRRWGRRLEELGEKLGIGIVTAVLVRVLLGS